MLFFLQFPIALVLSIICLAAPAWADFQAVKDSHESSDAATTSDKSTDKFNPDIFPRFDPKSDQSPDEGGTQKSHQPTEFEKAVDRCVEKVWEELSDTKFDVYANGETRRYGSDRKGLLLGACMKREGY